MYEGVSNLVGRVRKNSIDNGRVDLSSLDGSPERVPSKKRLSITGGDQKFYYVYTKIAGLPPCYTYEDNNKYICIYIYIYIYTYIHIYIYIYIYQ
jgi:hypothetical protein